MPLDPWQLNVVKTARNRERQLGVTLSILTGSGLKSDDAYRIQRLSKSTLRVFSGAVSWIPTSNRRDTEGGFSESSEVLIAVDRVEKSYLEQQDTILDVQGIELRVTRLTDLPETSEVLIQAARVEQR